MTIRIHNFIYVLLISLVACQFEEEFPKLSKQDRIDLAIKQEVSITKDLATGEVPKERLLPAKIFAQQLRNQKAAVAGINWEERGPNNVSGRTRVVHFDLSDPSGNKVWTAGVGGGLWLTNNFMSATPLWTPIDDFFDNIAITCFVQNPNNHNEMYFGTGEGWFNFDAIRGLGIWQSLDGGVSWTQLASTDNSNFHYVQDLDFSNNVLYASTRSRGVQRSTNAGASWTQVLGSTVGAGNTNRAADLEVGSDGDVYATLGIGSADGAIFKSDFSVHGSNTGALGNWTNISPSGTFRRIEMCVAPSNPNRLYAFCQGASSNDVTDVFSSDNGGGNWTSKPVPNFCDQGTTGPYTRSQAWYDLIAIVDPTDPDVVYTGGVDAVRSDDIANTWTQITSWTGGWGGGGCNTFNDEVHADHHDMAFAPTGSNDLVIATDGGLHYSTNSDAASPTFNHKNTGYNITQFYAGDLHPSTGINEYLAGAQDNGTQHFVGAGLTATTEVTGGDGAFCHIDQLSPNIQISSFVYNRYRVTLNGWATRTFRNFNSGGSFINPTDYDDNAKVLYGAQSSTSYFRWNNPASAGNSSDIVSVSGMGATIRHVRVSPNVANRVYFGLSNGEVVYIDNAHTGTSKSAVTIRNGLGSVSCIEIDPNDENHLLVSYSNYGLTSVFESFNGGTNWISVEGNLPDMPIRWALFAPNSSDQALLATELGVWSTDNLDGNATIWGPSNGGLANVRVDMIKHRVSDDQIVAATHGRGLYTTDHFSTLLLNFGSATSTGVEDGLDGTLAAPKNCVTYTDYLVPVTLSKDPGAVAEVNFSINSLSTAQEDIDFEIVENSPLTFGVNEKIKNLTIRVYDDGIIEGDETVIIDIASATPALVDGLNLQHTFTLLDNDVDPNGTNRLDILTEDFQGGLPAAWTITDLTGGGAWAYSTSGPQNFSGDALNSTTGNNGFMLLDSDGFGNDGIAEESELILPAINCVGFTNVTLDFEQLFRKYLNESTTVEVSNDGLNYTSFAVGTNASLATNATTTNPELINIDISAIADGESTVFIRFRWTGSWDYYWEIDDIVVSGDFTTQVETILAESDEQYIGPNETVHFYGSDEELIATVVNGNYDYGCTSIELVRAGNSTQEFWNNNITNQVMSKVLRITPTNNTPLSTETYDLSLYYDQSEVLAWTSATGQLIQDIQLIKVSGATFDQITPNNSSFYSNVTVLPATEGVFNTDHFELSTTSSGFSDYLAGIPGSSGTVLPVELLSFKGQSMKEYNLLSWVTLTEINNDGFYLQKSSNGVDFENISWISGAGNTNKRQRYEYRDFNQGALTYYRLLQVDYDGSSENSKIITIQGQMEVEPVTIYPNPFSDDLFLRTNGRFSYAIYNVNGVLLKAKTSVSGNEHIQTGRWEAGMYTVVISQNGEVKSYKLLKI